MLTLTLMFTKRQHMLSFIIVGRHYHPTSLYRHYRMNNCIIILIIIDVTLSNTDKVSQREHRTKPNIIRTLKLYTNIIRNHLSVIIHLTLLLSFQLPSFVSAAPMSVSTFYIRDTGPQRQVPRHRCFLSGFFWGYNR